MFIAVIRGDLSKAIFIDDVEPKSQANPSTETPKGQTQYLSRPDPVAIGSYLTAQGLVASASALITATVPVGGPVNISPTAIKAVTGLSGASNTQVSALQNLLAHHFVETDVVKKSFLYGNIAGFASSTFNPDPHRNPALSNGPAIGVVQDDGTSVFTFAGPVVTTAATNTPSLGALRISGSGFTPEGLYEFSVILIGTGGKHLTQAAIVAAGGAWTDSQINIPATLVVGVAAGFTSARVRVNNLLSAAVALT